MAVLIFMRCCLLQVYLARGKVLGGSSATNATLYMRGTSQDYDSWNMAGWGAKEALHGFIKCEDNGNGRASVWSVPPSGGKFVKLLSHKGIQQLFHSRRPS